MPSLPLPLCFALAAVVAPTDPVAVSSIAGSVAVPRRMMHILSGESMLNDASALVCLRIAVAATLGGGFSLAGATGQFLWMALAGAFVGAVVAWGVTRVQRLLDAAGPGRAGAAVLVSLLVPFGAYLAGERIGASGVLAAAVAGIVTSRLEPGEAGSADHRLHRAAVWDAVRFALNGTMFVLLGEQLPATLSGAGALATSTGLGHVGWLVALVLGVVMALMTVRYVWLRAALGLSLFRDAPWDALPAAERRRAVAAMTCAGARGAMTLAATLTLPLALADGSAFPGRELVVFVAAGVILASLAIASVGLPMLLRDATLPDGDGRLAAAEDAARVVAAQAAIEAVQALHDRIASEDSDAGGMDANEATASRLVDMYRARIDLVREARDADRREGRGAPRPDIARRLRRAGTEAEREAIERLARRGELANETVVALRRELDLLDLHLGD